MWIEVLGLLSELRGLFGAISCPGLMPWSLLTSGLHLVQGAPGF